MGAFSLQSDKMRFLLVAFVLTIVIASCVAQPQGQVQAAAAAPVQEMTPSDRHYRRGSRSYGRSYGRYGFGGCSGGGSNNNVGNLSNLIANLNNVVNLLNNLIGQNGLLNNLGNQAAGARCIVGLQCASGQCTNNACT